MFCLRIGLLLCLVSGTLSQDGFDLADAFDDGVPPTPAKPKEQPKAPEKPKNDGGLDLSDAFGPDEPPTKKPQKPSSGDSGFDFADAFDNDGFDFADALDDGVPPTPAKPKEQPKAPEKPKNDGFDLADALDDGVPPTPAKPKEQPKAPEKPKNDDCQGILVQKLNAIIENQNQQLRLLQLMVRSPRFNG